MHIFQVLLRSSKNILLPQVTLVDNKWKSEALNYQQYLYINTILHKNFLFCLCVSLSFLFIYHLTSFFTQLYIRLTMQVTLQISAQFLWRKVWQMCSRFITQAFFHCSYCDGRFIMVLPLDVLLLLDKAITLWQQDNKENNMLYIV